MTDIESSYDGGFSFANASSSDMNNVVTNINHYLNNSIFCDYHIEYKELPSGMNKLYVYRNHDAIDMRDTEAIRELEKKVFSNFNWNKDEETKTISIRKTDENDFNDAKIAGYEVFDDDENFYYMSSNKQLVEDIKASIKSGKGQNLAYNKGDIRRYCILKSKEFNLFKYLN